MNYSFGTPPGGPRLRHTFRRIFQALEPGGVFVFDVAEPARALEPARKHTQGTDWAVLLEVTVQHGGNAIDRKITAFRKVGRLYRRSEETHRVRLFPRSVIAAELRDAGFRVRLLSGYGKRRFPRGIAGFLARKP